MFRYFGFVWDSDDASGRAEAQLYIDRLLATGDDWHSAITRPGLVALYTNTNSPNQLYALQPDGGVILGTLFAKSTNSSSTAASPNIDSQESTKLLTSGGRHLIQHFWGRYVAFLYDAETRTTRVLRDPTGSLPCFNMRVGRMEMYFSRIEDAAGLGLHLSVNWDYVAAHLCYQRLEINYTGLNEVTRVLGGECVTHRQGAKTRAFYWNPLQIAESNLIEDPIEAIAVLRQCTLDSVHTWAASYRRIVHTLSGGLDSAIVLACLQQAPIRPEITCVNYHSPGAAGDERMFARLAAQHAGFELLERERDTAIRFDPLLTMPRAAAPSIYRYYLENSRQESELAHERGATALFSGEGGDQVFYQAQASFGAGDFLYRRGVRGFGSDFFRIALDGARVDRLSVWQVLHKALLHACLGRRWTLARDIGKFHKLIPSELIDAVMHDTRWVHPHYQDPGRTPSGKLWHAFALLFPGYEYYDPIGLLEGVERVAPLFSQPLLEVCLRTPVDVLTVGGWDRAIARRAFKRELPKKIAARRGKGMPDEYVKIVLAHNLGFVREMLLGGQLIHRNLVDRAKLERVLSSNPNTVSTGGTEIYDYLSAEAWLQRFVAGASQMKQP